MRTLAKAMLMMTCVGLLAGCDWNRPPAVNERPVLDALDWPIAGLTRCVVAREWGCTTTHTREIVAIVEAGRG